MLSLDFVGSGFTRCPTPFSGHNLLPSPGVVIHRSPFISSIAKWDNFLSAFKELKNKLPDIKYVYIDACWDPVRINDQEIINYRTELSTLWPEVKILVLSAKAEHYYQEQIGYVYFPLFLMLPYPELIFPKRSGRISCLNRRNAPHRVWLMHHLLEQNLLDPNIDIYSVAFTDLYTDSYYDADNVIGTTWFNQAQKQWPKRIATHDDGFPSDYSINHPAWHTGITIITETESGKDTIICEKTAKGILSKSCFSIYMSETGYKVLEDLGFEPRYFTDHAEDYNIVPIIKICQDIRTESQALEYRKMHLDKIEHNFKQFAYSNSPIPENQRPWFSRFEPKLQLALNNL